MGVKVDHDVPVVGTEMLAWDAASKTFSAEISDLQLSHSPRVLRLRSHVTGKYLDVALYGVDTHGSGSDKEVTAWRYAAEDPKVYVVLYND